MKEKLLKEVLVTVNIPGRPAQVQSMGALEIAYTMQVPLQSAYCCLRYAYSWVMTVCLELLPFCSYIVWSLSTKFGVQRKGTYTWICFHLSLAASVILSCQMFVLSTLFILVKHTVTYLWLREGLWVGIARKVCWLACCKIRLDIFRHPAASGMLHFTYFLLDISSGTLNRMVVCVMEYRVCVGNTRIIKSLGMSHQI